MILTPVLANRKHSWRTQLLLTGSSTIAFTSSLIYSTRECLELLTIWCTLNGSIVVALMFMVWHGWKMHQMWRLFSQPLQIQKLTHQMPLMTQVSQKTLHPAKQQLIEYINRTVSTINPAVLPDGSNVADAPLPKTNPHILRGCILPSRPR